MAVRERRLAMEPIRTRRRPLARPRTGENRRRVGWTMLLKIRDSGWMDGGLLYFEPAGPDCCYR